MNPQENPEDFFIWNHKRDFNVVIAKKIFIIYFNYRK